MKEIEYEKPKKAKLIDNIEHQGIGGKVIILEREMSFFTVAGMSTIAVWNFVNRRMDLSTKAISDWHNIKCYYGHVGNLGYFVAEDEIDGEIEDVTWSEAAEYLND